MDKEGLQVLLEKAANPDTQAQALLQLKEETESLLTSLQSLTTERSELAEKVKELRDSNMRLFLRVTESAPQEAETEPEKTGAEVLDDFTASMQGYFDKKGE